MTSKDDSRTADLWKYADRLTGFHRAWHSGTAPDISEFLPAPGEASEETHRQLLAELIIVDLEHQWQHHVDSTQDGHAAATLLPTPNKPPLLEDYVNRWPQLGTLDDLPLSVIVQEYRIRCRYGDHPDHDDYARRFPAHSHNLNDYLSTVDEEEGSTETTDTMTLLLAQSPQRPDDTTAETLLEDITPVERQAAAPIPIMPNKPPQRRTSDRFGNYDLLDKIARGAMGVVYKARQRGVDRIVALKTILTGSDASEEEVRRFLDEARNAGILEHPNIVRIYDSGTFDDQHYIAMAYVDGKTLAEIVRENTVGTRKAAEYVKKAAEAIQYAHSLNVLHRDLKPANIMIDGSDEPQITDFGLAKRVDDDSEATRDGSVLGTPSYMPPEQAQGRVQDITVRSDVYSLGAVLYHLLAGRPPFVAPNVLGTLMQVVDEEPVRPSVLNHKVDPDLEAICLKCLQKNPRNRFATAQQLADDLGRFLRGEPTVTRPISLFGHFAKWCRRNPVVATLSMLAMIGAAVSIAALVVLSIQGTTIASQRRELGVQTEKLRVQTERLQQQTDAVEKQEQELATVQQTLGRSKKELANKQDEIKKMSNRLAAAQTAVDAANQEKMTAVAARDKALEAQRVADTEAAKATKAAANAKEAEEAAKRQRNKHREMQITSMRRLFNILTREKLEHIPHSERVRQEVAEEALALVEQDLQQNPGDPESTLLACETLRLRGTLHRLLGEDSSEDFRGAVDRLEKLREHPESLNSDQNAHCLSELALSCRSLGDILTDSEQYDDAKKHYDRARECLEILTRQSPKSADYLFEFGRTLNSTGLYQAQCRHLPEAIAAYRQSIDVHAKALQLDATGDVKYVEKLAIAHGNLAGALLQSGQIDEAVQQFDEAIKYQQPLVDAEQPHPYHVQDFARSHRNRGLAYRDRGLSRLKASDAAAAEQDFAAAETDLNEAVKRFGALARDFAATPGYRYLEAVTRKDLAELAQLRGNVAKERQETESAIQLLDSLVTEFPNDPNADEYERTLSQTYLGIGSAMLDRAVHLSGESRTNTLDQANRYLTSALQHRREKSVYRAYLYRLLGACGAMRTDYAGAIQSFRQGIDILEQLVANQQAVDVDRVELISLYLETADVATADGAYSTADEMLDRATTVLKTLGNRDQAAELHEHLNGIRATLQKRRSTN